MKTLSIYDMTELLQKLTKASLEVNTVRVSRGEQQKRLRICPKCKEVSESTACTHQKEMH